MSEDARSFIPDDVKSFIEKMTELISVSRSLDQYEKEERASLFLAARADIEGFLFNLNNAMAEVSTLTDACFSKAIFSSEGTSITEKKYAANKTENYIVAKQKLLTLEADIHYLKSIADIFQNAHVMWRQFCKDG
jgi:S-adenosylhomocysteine hydrolase